jgi:N-formylglutamate deformylase
MDEPEPRTVAPGWTVFHVPHASRVVPLEVREAIIISREALDLELDRLTDHFIDDLLVPDDAGRRAVAAPVSRFAVDVERFVDDAREPMARRGMGAVYLWTSHGEALRTVPAPDERAALIARYYEPHHRRLAEAVQAALDVHGRAVIIDAHSFADRPLPCDLDQDPDRPDLCIGTDSFHTPPDLVDRLRRRFVAAGCSVAIDRPYAGALVPQTFYRSDERVVSVMIEVNRRLYMDEAAVARSRDFDAVRNRLLAAMIGGVVDWAARVDSIAR